MAHTLPFDAAETLNSPEEVEAFLEDAFQESDPAFIAHALGIVARAAGMGKIAEAAGVSRQTLYKALSSEGNPTLATAIGVLKALGFKLVPERVGDTPEPAKGLRSAPGRRSVGHS